MASMSIVIPTDLCRASKVSFRAPEGRSSNRVASVNCVMMSTTMSQCSDCATAPQRYAVFLIAMSFSLCA